MTRKTKKPNSPFKQLRSRLGFNLSTGRRTLRRHRTDDPQLGPPRRARTRYSGRFKRRAAKGRPLGFPIHAAPNAVRSGLPARSFDPNEHEPLQYPHEY
jgi:hypothetical protein